MTGKRLTKRAVKAEMTRALENHGVPRHCFGFVDTQARGLEVTVVVGGAVRTYAINFWGLSSLLSLAQRIAQDRGA